MDEPTKSSLSWLKWENREEANDKVVKSESQVELIFIL